VSAAIRVQAVDYLLKPVTSRKRAGIAAVFKLKERFLSLKRERMHAKRRRRDQPHVPRSAGGRHCRPCSWPCLFCAGAMPNAADADPHSHASDVWQKLSLAGMGQGAVRRHPFVQEYMGDTPAECILAYQPAEDAGREWTPGAV
jgi:hypothetical protein